MSRTSLVYTSFLMSLIGLLFLGQVYKKLNGAEQSEKVALFWKKQLGKEQSKRLLLVSQFAEYKQEVASLLPGSDTENLKMRSLASLIPAKRDKKNFLAETADRLLGIGKGQIRDKDYGTGIKTLEKLIHEHPDSVHVVEAHYLIVEAYTQLGNYAGVIKGAEKMVELFPEDGLTGYALLKVGSIFEKEGRLEDALDVYRTVVSAYPEKGLAKRAKSAAKRLEL